MIDTQLLSYIRQQLSLNVGRETITANLKGAGWTDADLDEVFKAIEKTNAMSIPVSASPATPEAAPNIAQPQTNFSDKPYTKSKKILLFVLFVLAGGAAYLYYSSMLVSPSDVSTKIIQDNQTKTSVTDTRIVSPEQNEPDNEMDRTQILGNKDDLVSFSIWPGSKVHGIVFYRGVIKGAYFFEANIGINVLDKNKNILKRNNAMATGEWMTSGPVNFEGSIDFSGLPKGPAYFEIHNDNPSDLRENDKSILIPIVIE